MKLEINVSDSCVKKIKALQRLKQLDADQVEYFLSEGLEAVVTHSIFDELGMEPVELGFTKSAEAMPRPSTDQDEVQSQVFTENQHNLSSDEDEVDASDVEAAEEREEEAEFDFSFVESNISNAIKSGSDEDMVDSAIMDDFDSDNDEPDTTQKARKAARKFTTPKVKISNA